MWSPISIMGEYVTTWKAIPGETPIDPSGLRRSLRGRVHNRDELIPYEAQNIRIVIKKYLASMPSRSKVPFTEKWALKVHKEMFGKVWTWSGTFRTFDVTIGIPAEKVQTEFHKLFADIHCWQESNMTLLEQAATLHYRAVKIHPFQNGNGRWARLLANIWLRQHGHALTYWPETGLAGGESPIRQEYIAALKEANKYNLKPLIELHERYTAATVNHGETESDET